MPGLPQLAQALHVWEAQWWLIFKLHSVDLNNTVLLEQTQEYKPSVRQWLLSNRWAGWADKAHISATEMTHLRYHPALFLLVSRQLAKKPGRSQELLMAHSLPVSGLGTPNWLRVPIFYLNNDRNNDLAVHLCALVMFYCLLNWSPSCLQNGQRWKIFGDKKTFV